MAKKKTGGLKFDEGKPRYDLVPYDAVEEVVNILTMGAKKYSDRNWEEGISAGRLFGAAMRHLTAWWRKSGPDEESGKSHLAHAACCVLMLLAQELRKMDKFDNRPDGGKL
jgi:hypothetical protein